MDASDLIKALQMTLRGGARPHMENAAGNRRASRGQAICARLAILGRGRLHAGLLRLGEAHRPAGRSAEELYRAERPAANAAGGAQGARTRAEPAAAELKYVIIRRSRASPV